VSGSRRPGGARQCCHVGPLSISITFEYVCADIDPIKTAATANRLTTCTPANS